jgi:transcription initiation factor IIE alpha subunit
MTKQTSIAANIKAEAFKGSHKKRIINCMEGAGVLTGNQIAELCGLTFVQVMRRLIETVRDKKIIERGSKKGFTTYELIY